MDLLIIFLTKYVKVILPVTLFGLIISMSFFNKSNRFENILGYQESYTYPSNFGPKNKWFCPLLFFTYTIIFFPLAIITSLLFLMVTGDINKYMQPGQVFNDYIIIKVSVYLTILLAISTIVEIARILILAYSTKVEIYFDKIIVQNIFRKTEIPFIELTDKVRIEDYKFFNNLERSFEIKVPKLIIPTGSTKSGREFVLYAFLNKDADLIKKIANSNLYHFG